MWDPEKFIPRRDFARFLARVRARSTAPRHVCRARSRRCGGASHRLTIHIQSAMQMRSLGASGLRACMGGDRPPATRERTSPVGRTAPSQIRSAT